MSPKIETGVRQFLDWLAAHGTAGLDPYDLWASGYGLASRRAFYAGGVLGKALAAPLVALDRLSPRLARLGSSPKTYATSHAQFILTFLHLSEAWKKPEYLQQAETLAYELEKMAAPGFSGLCWGYPFDWQNRRGLWPKNTPLITVTPYAFEAFVALHEVTAKAAYLDKARSIVQFALHDLKSSPRSSGAVASSYSPLDQSLIVNASAYRAMVLAQGAKLFALREAGDLAERLVRFVVESQSPDGSWPYALDPGDDFIDHFHTCFVLKNLAKIDRLTESPDIRAAVERGYDFYQKNLFWPDGLPKPFCFKGDRQLRYNLYDLAEAISLGVTLKEMIPQAYAKAQGLAERAVSEFQCADGHFVTAAYRWGGKNTVPYIRWAQAQTVYALSRLLN